MFESFWTRSRVRLSKAFGAIRLLAGLGALAAVFAGFSEARAQAAIANAPMIFDVRRSLPLDPGEPVFHDFYVNAGPEAGFKKGMYVSVVRAIPVHDPVQNKQQGTLNVEVAKLQIIHVERNITVARLHSRLGDEERPTLEFEAVMIGDRIDPSGMTMEAPPKRGAKASTKSAALELMEETAPATTSETAPNFHETPSAPEPVAPSRQRAVPAPSLPASHQYTLAMAEASSTLAPLAETRVNDENVSIEIPSDGPVVTAVPLVEATPIEEPQVPAPAPVTQAIVEEAKPVAVPARAAAAKKPAISEEERWAELAEAHAQAFGELATDATRDEDSGAVKEAELQAEAPISTPEENASPWSRSPDIVHVSIPGGPRY